MALRRVPGGHRNYFADDRGFKEIAMSKEMGDATLAVAQRYAGNAEAVGKSKYGAEPRTVQVGWDNEDRRGAAVVETEKNPADWRNEILLRVGTAMAIRRRR